MKKTVFEGCGTALITPFKKGRIDYSALGRIIEFQIKSGVSALVVGGTTGEAATLSNRERYALYEFAKEKVANRCKLILGVGTNDTAIAVKHAKCSAEIGCDAFLAVTPYYNKGTDEGIYMHYMKLADASDTPLILYNVPSRTGVNMSIDIIERLAQCERVVGIKEASDSQDRLVKLSAFGDELALYAGNDSAIHTVMSLGGRGVISVVSNLYPAYIEGMCHDYLSGEEQRCHYKQTRLLPLIDAIFKETNPTPVKYAMSRKGYCKSEMRLPLAEAVDKTKLSVEKAMAEFEKNTVFDNL